MSCTEISTHTEHQQNVATHRENGVGSACISSGKSVKEHPHVFAFRSEMIIWLGRIASLVGLTSLSLSLSTELRWGRSLADTAVQSPSGVLSNLEDSFRAGEWLVVPQLNRIELNDENVHMEPRAMEVLLCLSRKAGKVVSKEELISNVWPNTFVTDDVLKGCIWQLRRAFNDDSKSPKVIETIPKRGYRLLLPVYGHKEESPSSKSTALTRMQ